MVFEGICIVGLKDQFQHLLIQDPQELVGRKIGKVLYCSDTLVVQREDGYIFILHAGTEKYDGYGEFRIAKEIEVYQLRDLGLISQKQIDDEQKERQKLQTEAAKEARRKQFEQLRKEFNDD